MRSRSLTSARAAVGLPAGSVHTSVAEKSGAAPRSTNAAPSSAAEGKWKHHSAAQKQNKGGNGSKGEMNQNESK